MKISQNEACSKIGIQQILVIVIFSKIFNMRNIIKFQKKERNVSLKVPNPHSLFSIHCSFLLPPHLSIGCSWLPTLFPNREKVGLGTKSGHSLQYGPVAQAWLDKQINEGSVDTQIPQCLYLFNLVATWSYNSFYLMLQYSDLIHLILLFPYPETCIY